jgi:hypothetical protein
LAVFIGSGKEGYRHVSNSGKLSRKNREILARKYVCVYVNVREKEGKGLARTFHVNKGLVLSDHKGKVQAFRHQGKLPNKELNRYLVKYSRPQVVRKTTTSPRTRLRRYGGRFRQRRGAPMMFGGFGGGGGGC